MVYFKREDFEVELVEIISYYEKKFVFICMWKLKKNVGLLVKFSQLISCQIVVFYRFAQQPTNA